MKRKLQTISAAFAALAVVAAVSVSIKVQAAPDVIPTSLYTVDTVNSQTDSDPFTKCLDDDSSTFWNLRTAAGNPFPVFAVISLADTHNICGVSYLCNKQNPNDKLLDYEIYVSLDGEEWGEPQARGRIYWEGSDDVAGKDLLFGAVKGRYVKIVYLDNANTWNYVIQTVELRLLEDPDADTAVFKRNQYLNLDEVPQVVNALEPADLNGMTSAGYKAHFRVISGPAEVHEMWGGVSDPEDTVPHGPDQFFFGTGLICTGQEGTVVLEAYHDGDSAYYPTVQRFSLKVENPSLYGVQLTTPLTEAEPLVMPCDTLSYLLQARAQVGSQFNTINEAQFKVDGEPLETRFHPQTGLMQALFHPGRYGEFKIEIYAQASNGRDTVVVRNLTVDSAEDTRTVRAFDGEIINFPDPGMYANAVCTFPQHQGNYWRITAKLEMKCPKLGLSYDCDDWDRWAWIEVQTPDGQWREIIRYITSYGKPCSHELDVTDFASLLQGELPVRMYIETWGSGGYEIYLDFEFSKGISQYLYTTATPLWRGNFPFGDMARLQPLDTLTVPVSPDAVAFNLKVVNTGHGWGNNNTGNAAEFYHARHHLYVDDEEFEQDLWRTCNPNPDGCSPQNGTWQYARAGWCPGAISPGDDFNASKHTGKESLTLKYIFQENYRDWCHPHNPDCVSGKTCNDCDDTFNPQYVIASYLISYFNKMYDVSPYEPVDTTANEHGASMSEPLDFGVYPNPVSERFFVRTTGETGPGSLQLLGSDGRVCMSRIFDNAAHLSGTEFRVANLPSGLYFVRISTRHRTGVKKLIVNNE